MRSITAAAIGICIGLAVGAGTAQRWGGDIAGALGSFPQPLATIIAAAVAAGVVAWQARKGFQAVIAGHNLRAQIETDAREHQNRLDRQLGFDEKAREALVAISNAIDEYQTWITSKEDQLLWWKEDAGKTSPMNRALAIASMYFPSTIIGLMDLTLAGDTYVQWMRQRYLDAGSGPTRDPTFNSGAEFVAAFNEAYTPYLRKLSEVLASLRTIGKTTLFATVPGR